KLEATEANLLRIGDVIKEVKRQIGSLQRQAGKARRYQTLHADLRVLETHFSRKQLDALEADFSDCHKEIECLTESERATRAQIDNSESSLAKERRALDKIDTGIAESRAEVQRLESEIAAHRSRIEFNQQRAEEVAELIQRARSESTCVQIEQLAKEIQTLSSGRDKLLRQIAASLKTNRREAVDVQASLQKKEQLLSEAEQNLAVLERTLAEKRSRLDVLRQLNEEGEGLAQGSQAVLKGVDDGEKF